MIVVNDVFLLSVSKTEAFRWSIGIRIKKKTELVEGAVLESEIEQSLARVCMNFPLVKLIADRYLFIGYKHQKTDYQNYRHSDL